MVFGTSLLYSAVYNDPKYDGIVIKHIIFYVLGFFVLFGSALIDYRWIIKKAWYIYSLGILSLIGLYFFGSVYNGARGWYQLPGFNVQPAELVKLVLIIIIARLLAQRDGEPLLFWRDIVPIGIVTFLPFIMVFDHPDLGNAIIYLVILTAMLWIGNIKIKYVIVFFILLGIFLSGFMYLYNNYHDQLEHFLEVREKSHWLQRIDTFLRPETASFNEKYQSENSKIAIGSGALLGEGYLQGKYVHNGSIPYSYSDSIFVVIGEEFGFIGASLLLFLYFFLLYRLILIAINAVNKSGSYVVVGVTAMFVFQIFENIGMLIGLMPLTGITLPFISYGGSSLLINMLSVGLILSVAVHQDPLPEQLD